MENREEIELRKEVIEFMIKEGQEIKLTLDGNPIPYGIVIHLIAAFYEHKTRSEEDGTRED